MRGWLTIVAVGAALMTTSGWAQMRGGRAAFARSRPAAAMVRPAPVMGRGAIAMHRAPGFSPFFVNRPFFRHGFRGPFFFNPRFRFGFRRHAFFFSSFAFGPYAYYPPYYPYSYAPMYDTADNTYQLQGEIAQLSDEIERLRQDEAELRSAPPSPPPATSPQPQPQSKAGLPPPTTLVFRDGTTEQVRNYAIVGHTLWVFSEQRARKLPLSSLDLPATEKANEEAGVRFDVPKQR